jgi:glyoxylase-like metal-dependent hydrolase (beta-lactamase superfamily II)
MRLIVHPFFDTETSSFSYVLVDPGSRVCAVIDPVLGYTAESAQVDTDLADRIVEFVKANDLIVEWLLETHVHADHLSASRYLKSRFVCAQLGIGAQVVTLQQAMAQHLSAPIAVNGSQFDRLFENGERICLGHSCGRAMVTPGHTPACVSYVFEGLVFVGDAMFMPDFGSGRCDFPGGDPLTLHASAQQLMALPGSTALLTGHDYAPGGRHHQFSATVAEQRQSNIHLGQNTSADEFARMRSERDALLDMPDLMEVAVPFNLVAGRVSPGELEASAEGLAA